MSLQAELGRDLHGKRWGPRPLDLDIIFYGGVQHNEDGLQIPHPRWEERPFVQASFTCRQHMVLHPVMALRRHSLHAEQPSKR